MKAYLMSKTNEVVRDIKDKIINHVLKPGDKLLPLRELATEYNTSRSVINSAIHILSAKGYLEVNPRHFVMVTDFLYSGSLEIVQDIYHLSRNDLKKKTLREVLSLRFLVELDAIENIVKTNRNIDKLIDILNKEKACLNSKDYRQKDIIKLDCNFHETLVYSANNSVLFLLYMSFNEIEHDLVKKFYDNKVQASNIISNHEILVEAIKTGNIDKAKEIWTSVLKQGEDIVLENI